MHEHCDVVANRTQTINRRTHVIAGPGNNSTAPAVFYTQMSKDMGADACLLVAPYYNRPSQEGLYQHFKQIAEEVDIPQILYNVPGRRSEERRVGKECRARSRPYEATKESR